MSLSILRLAYNETFHSECHSAVYCLYQAALLKTYLKQDFSEYFNSWFGRCSVAVWQGISIKLRNLSTSVYSEQSTFINWDINVDYVNRKNLHNMTHLEKKLSDSEPHFFTIPFKRGNNSFKESKSKKILITLIQLIFWIPTYIELHQKQTCQPNTKIKNKIK